MDQRTIITRGVVFAIFIMSLWAPPHSALGQNGYPPPEGPQATPGANLNRRLYLPALARAFPNPPASASYYVGSVNAVDIRSEADALAAQTTATADARSWLVVLSFCNPGTGASETPPNPIVQGAWLCRGKGFVSTTRAASIAIEFANRWLSQIGQSRTADRLTLVLGVNNFSNYSTAHAQAWATARAYARAIVTSPQVQFVAGMDAEVEWGSDPNHAANTIAWLNAYMNGSNNCLPSAGGGACFYNFGDANCGLGSVNQSCGFNDWDKDDIWYLSAGAKRGTDALPFAAAVPLIYNTVGTNARQWQSVSLYGATTSGKRVVYFVGPMSGRGACDQTDPLPRSPGGSCDGTDNDSNTAYDQLYRALMLDTRTAQLIYWRTDIRYHMYVP